ncbi:hypothetical protein LPJ74_004564 [Coemansia sp. RSA 1843]|nr:hypothetical protein LPJ74_004564 [Coemansia sp. RSA 1843]
MAPVYPAALSHFAVFCPSLGADEESAHEQLLFYAAATLPAFYPYSANDYFARNVHLRRRSSGGNNVTETSTGSLAITATAAAAGRRVSRSPTSRVIATDNSSTKSEDNAATTRERVVSLDMKLREIGLGAALLAFAGTFGADSRRFHIVHSEKRRTLIFQPEPGILIQLSVVLPRRVRPYGKEKDAYSIEFLDSQISDSALEAWLRQEYWAFRMLFGPISRVMHNRTTAVRQLVKRQLDLFFGRTMWAWDSRWDPKAGLELDLLHSVQPLPQLHLGSISLGGFEEFWRDLSLLSTDVEPSNEMKQQQQQQPGPLVHDAVVLWRGYEIVWSSWLLPDSAGSVDNGQAEDKAHLLRALVAWSRAVYAPVFDVAAKKTASETTGDLRGKLRQNPMSPPSRPASVLSAGSSRTAERPNRPPLAAAAAAAASSATATAAGAAGGWGAFPGSSWLWGWSGQQSKQRPSVSHGAISSDECINSGSTSNRSSIDEQRQNSPTNNAIGGGISQALSRAVNLLVEPNPPTPPEEDPVFAATDPAIASTASQQHQDHTNSIDQYVISASDIDASGTRGDMLVRDSDVESLWSVGSLASVKTTRTTATAAPALGPSRAIAQRSSVGRVRSSTIQQGNVLGGTSNPSYSFLSRAPHLSRHSRTPSGVSSVGTAGSTQLRDDTRVSLRSWWPASWSWGSAQQQQQQQEEEEEVEELSASRPKIDVHYSSPQSSSGINMDSTFLFTGENPFPGAGTGASRERADKSNLPDSNRAEHILVKDTEEPTGSESNNQETIDQLGLAMDEEMPAVYEHGAGVDGSRGVVLAPRAVEGMLYDTRLVKLLYDDESGDSGNRVRRDKQFHEQRPAAMLELPLFVGSNSRQQGPPPCGHDMQATRTPVQQQQQKQQQQQQKQKQQMEDIGTRCSRTLVYKYGDMLYIVFGAPKTHYTYANGIDKGKGKQMEPSDDPEIVGGNRRGRRARKERRRRAAAAATIDEDDALTDNIHAAEDMRFGKNETLAIESAILRYAESLQAATRRDVGEIRAQQQSEVQLAKQRRIPPYMYHKEERVAEKDRRDGNENMQRLATTLTNWRRQDTMPVNRSFMGLVDNGKGKREAGGESRQQSLLLLPENVRTALSAVNAELVKHRENDDGVSVCVRMQDKGWVTAQQRRQEQTFCVVDQPNATLADAHNFLSRISKRARSLDSSR